MQAKLYRCMAIQCTTCCHLSKVGGEDVTGKCVDTSGSTNLTKGELYYLFPHGGHAYCASRFLRPDLTLEPTKRITLS